MRILNFYVPGSLYILNRQPWVSAAAAYILIDCYSTRHSRSLL